MHSRPVQNPTRVVWRAARDWAFGLLLVVCALAAGPAAAGSVIAKIVLSQQEMTVTRDGAQVYQWPVSTARAGKVTPTGTFIPQAMKKIHYSTLYHNAPMPWSIFFYGNYAIHGTTELTKLGTPASAGCVRLAPENAKLLFELVRDVGMADTRILIVP